MNKPWQTYDISIVCASWTVGGIKHIFRDQLPLDKLPNSYETILVDNRVNSSEGLGPRLCSKIVRPFAYESGIRNVGISRGWNMGANMAEGELIVFVNDDVEFSSPVLMLEEMRKYKNEAGVIGFEGGYRKVDGEKFNFSKTRRVDEPTRVDSTVGWFWATPFEIFAELGGLDIRFSPCGGEETDYACQVKEAGYDCLAIPVPDGADIGHTYGLSANPQKIRWLEQSEEMVPDITDRNDWLTRKKWDGFESVKDKDEQAM